MSGINIRYNIYSFFHKLISEYFLIPVQLVEITNHRASVFNNCVIVTVSKNMKEMEKRKTQNVRRSSN